MTVDNILAQLATLGDEQTLNHYLQQGMPETVFGVNFTRLSKLKKELGKDQDLAVALWQTGQPDAQILATMVSDSDALSENLFDQWAHSANYTSVADALGRLLTQLPFATSLGERYRMSAEEWPSRIGWQEAAVLAQKHLLSDDTAERLLQQLAERIHNAPNQTKDAMIMALIAIGLTDPTWRAEAEVVAEQLGELHIDHGKTGHRTPNPIHYLDRAWARKEL